MTIEKNTIRLGVDHPDWSAHRDTEPQAEAAPPSSLELFVVVAGDPGATVMHSGDMFDVWATSVENAHLAVAYLLRVRRDDHGTAVVGVWETKQRKYL